MSSSDDDLFSSYLWLTPSLQEEPVQEFIIKKSEKSLLVIGDKDPIYDQKVIDKMSKSGVPCMVLSGADHSLDVEGDISASLKAIKSLVSEISSGFIE